MQIFRHLTANNIVLHEMPFKRELFMEAYLIENENVLALDKDAYSSAEVLEAELTLERGRKSKETDGRIDLLETNVFEYSQWGHLPLFRYIGL